MGRSSTAVIICTFMALAGCSSSDDPPFDAQPPFDVPPAQCDGAGCNGGACNPLSPPGQQGCDPGEKCSWEVVQETPDRLGRTTCVPDGTVALGEACTLATVGAPDNCAAGLVCAGGVCRDICGLEGQADGACATDFNCTRYSSLFANGDDMPPFGACNPECDPITQLEPDGTDCGAGNGCYMLTSSTDTIAVCASAGDVGHGILIEGQAFANSCVPGAQPRRRSPSTMEVECGGLCRPADVTSTTNMASEGGVNPDNCQTKWGAAPPSDGLNGESCRYWWARESFDQLSTFSNTVGWCFKHAAFQYDTNGDMTDDAPFPRCITLTTGDVVPPIGNPPHNDAQFFWCTALPTMFGGAPFKPAVAPVLRTDRLRP